jgi:uncharacterized protein
MAIPARVSFVTLGVSDLDRATRFYQSFGWPLSSGSVPGDVSFFRTSGGLLALWGVREMAADIGLKSTAFSGVEDDGRFRATDLAMNLDSPEQVDEALKAAADAGGTVLKPGHRTPWGYQGYFADPDGHIWEAAYNPDFPIGADGRPTLP